MLRGYNFLALILKIRFIFQYYDIVLEKPDPNRDPNRSKNYLDERLRRHAKDIGEKCQKLWKINVEKVESEWREMTMLQDLIRFVKGVEPTVIDTLSHYRDWNRLC